MKIIHVNFSGSKGGAAIAALRISKALNNLEGVSSELWCAKRAAPTGCKTVFNFFERKLNGLKNIFLSRHLCRQEFSINLFPSSLVRKLNASDADVINLHWINAELISVKQLGQIKKPIVWTFHDMWAFCGGEHYTVDERYFSGYKGSEMKIEPGQSTAFMARVDVDRWVYLRKQKYWKYLNLHIVCPSNWLADCSARSALMMHVPTSVIHNCIDLNIFRPLENKAELRRKYGLPIEKKIMLFGAVDPSCARKGGDLLVKSLEMVDDKDQFAVAIFGQSSGEEFAGIETFWLGAIYEEEKLVEIYNCADIMCVPSRQDNLPNTCVEAHACGLPIVAFNIGGIPDIVEHQKTGYLAEPFDPAEFAVGIQWILEGDDVRYRDLSANARKKAMCRFNENDVARQYAALYRKILSGDGE